MKSNIDDILKLSVNERLEIVEQILDSLEQNSESKDIPDWHMEILQERLAKYKGNLSEGKSWEEATFNL